MVIATSRTSHRLPTARLRQQSIPRVATLAPSGNPGQRKCLRCPIYGVASSQTRYTQVKQQLHRAQSTTQYTNPPHQCSNPLPPPAHVPWAPCLSRQRHAVLTDVKRDRCRKRDPATPSLSERHPTQGDPANEARQHARRRNTPKQHAKPDKLRPTTPRYAYSHHAPVFSSATAQPKQYSSSPCSKNEAQNENRHGLPHLPRTTTTRAPPAQPPHRHPARPPPGPAAPTHAKAA